MSEQYTFDGIKSGNFTWTADGWYTIDADADKKALAARNAKAKELKAQGKRVVKFSLGDQLRSMGGIGSGRPHIQLYVKAYGVNAYEQ